MLRNWKPKHKTGTGKLKADYLKGTMKQMRSGNSAQRELSYTHTANRLGIAGIKTVPVRAAGNDRSRRLERKLKFC